jgi:hypothetical protein
MAAASLPASGSVMAKAAMVFPSARGVSHFCFCSSSPLMMMGSVPSPDPA